MSVDESKVVWVAWDVTFECPSLAGIFSTEESAWVWVQTTKKEWEIYDVEQCIVQ